MNNFIKKILLLSAASIAAISLSISAFADNSSTAPVERAAISSSASVDKSSSSEAAQTSTDSSESNATTDILSGNADLIKEQKIIHDSSEMQFIAVTTKAGNVFYILIDYTATQDNKSGEGAVYFLNKVDEQDLYALINSSDTSNDTADEGVFAERSDSSQTAFTESVAAEANVSETDSQAAASTSSKSGSSIGLYILIFVICAAVIVAYYFVKIRPKKNEVADDDDFEMDDYEINEDEEKSTSSHVEK